MKKYYFLITILVCLSSCKKDCTETMPNRSHMADWIERPDYSNLQGAYLDTNGLQINSNGVLLSTYFNQYERFCGKVFFGLNNHYDIISTTNWNDSKKNILLTANDNGKAKRFLFRSINSFEAELYEVFWDCEKKSFQFDISTKISLEKNSTFRYKEMLSKYPIENFRNLAMCSDNLYSDIDYLKNKFSKSNDALFTATFSEPFLDIVLTEKYAFVFHEKENSFVYQLSDKFDASKDEQIININDKLKLKITKGEGNDGMSEKSYPYRTEYLGYSDAYNLYGGGNLGYHQY